MLKLGSDTNCSVAGPAAKEIHSRLRSPAGRDRPRTILPVTRQSLSVALHEPIVGAHESVADALPRKPENPGEKGRKLGR